MLEREGKSNAGAKLDSMESNRCRVRLSNRTMVVNGVSRIPNAIFGVHDCEVSRAKRKSWGIESIRRIFPTLPATPSDADRREPAAADLAMYLECFFDRYTPALPVSNPQKWRGEFQGKLEHYAAEAKRQGRPRFIEFWNEPFLNWAIKPGVNYHPFYYDKFNINPGDPVRLRGESEFTEYLVWNRSRRVVRESDLQEDYHAAEHCPDGLGTGGSFEWDGRQYKIVERWVPEDPTQVHPFSGQQNRLFYERMLDALIDTFKQSGADIKVIGGWGIHLERDDWAGWRELYQPLMENFGDRLDGICEHHYGGDTRVVAASYETAHALMKSTMGRGLPIYNTEAAGVVSLDQPDSAVPKPGDLSDTTRLGSMLYTLRDIIHTLSICPDKIAARFAHYSDCNGGDEFAFKLLKPLRGDLLWCDSSDPDVWCVASAHGSRRCVTLLNTRISPVSVEFLLEPAGEVHIPCTASTVRMGDAGPELVSWETTVETDKKLELAPLQVVTLEWTASPNPAAGSPVYVDQFHCTDTLVDVEPGSRVVLELNLPRDQLIEAHGARIKYVVNEAGGIASLRVNGKGIDPTPGKWTIRQDIPLASLGADNEIEVSAGETGFSLWMMSVELLSGSERC